MKLEIKLTPTEIVKELVALEDELEDIKIEQQALVVELTDKNRTGPSGERLTGKAYNYWRNDTVTQVERYKIQIMRIKAKARKLKRAYKQESFNSTSPVDLLYLSYKLLLDICEDIEWDVTAEEQEKLDCIVEWLRNSNRFPDLSTCHPMHPQRKTFT